MWINSLRIDWSTVVSDPPITYTPHNDTAPGAEVSTLAAVYRFIIDSRVNTNAAGVSSTNGDDAERNLSDSASNNSTE
jgi:hypothetical protein